MTLAEVDADVRGILKRMRQRHPLRRLADEILSGAPPSGAADRLLAALREAPPARWRDRAIAAWLLGHVPMNDLQRVEAAPLLGQVVEGTSHRPVSVVATRARNALVRTASLVALTVLLAAAFFVPAGHADRFAEQIGHRLDYTLLALLVLPLYGSAMLTVFMPFISVGLDRESAERVRAAAASSLAALRMRESVDALLRGWCGRGIWAYDAGDACLHALVLVLPTLTADHYGTFAAETVPALALGLRRSSGTLRRDHQLAILDALALVGDGRACEDLEAYARDPASEPMRAEAERVLAILRERREREQAPRRLLRAAAEPEGSATLLRPAAGTADIDAELLVRAAECLREDLP